ncbi:MAG: hypothetical protein ABIA04_10555 [Pseudomonadota bacterium]
MVFGYCLMDEFILVCLLMGVLLFFSIKKRVSNKEEGINKSKLSTIHFIVFSVFMVYLIIESFRGYFVLNDFRMMRFVIFFSMLGFLSYVLHYKLFPLPTQKQILIVVILGSLLYFSLYLFHGVFSELVRGFNRFTAQGTEWAGSSVAMFPVITLIPALYSVFGKDSKYIFSAESEKKISRITWITLSVIIATSFYYDSRLSWIAITVFIVFSVPNLGIKKSLIIFGIFLLCFSFLSYGFISHGNFFENIRIFYDELFIAGTGQQVSDLDRKLQVLAGFRCISKNIHTFFFGTGFYTERYALIPYYIEVFSEIGIPTGEVEIVRPATFTSFLTGTGVVGVFFLVACFVLSGFEILFATMRTNPIKMVIILLMLFMAAFSIFISINLDMVLFYLCIMPSGIFILLSREERRKE